MDDKIDILLKFVAGELPVQKFENELYTNAALEELLRLSTDWEGTYIGQLATNLYDYLIALNYSNTNEKINAIDALQLYFKKEGISCSVTNKYSDLYGLILSSQPKYLDVDMQFIEKYILPTNDNLSKLEMKKIMRSNFEKYFRFQGKPPRWIQNPAWIIKNEKPLFFVGQLELKNDLFHDTGAVYVFLNEDTAEIEMIKQFY